jgi:hypothetical protein
MSIKENVDYVKTGLSSEEKFLESFVKSERFFKKYKTLIFAFVIIIIVGIIGFFIKENLVEVAKKKYKYAKIHALGFSDSLYAVESQGYLINVNHDFTDDRIYKFNFDNKERMIAIGNKIYFDSKYITLP